MKKSTTINKAVQKAEARDVILIDNLDPQWMDYLSHEEIEAFERGFQLGKKAAAKDDVFILPTDDEEENATIIFVGQEASIIKKINAL